MILHGDVLICSLQPRLSVSAPQCAPVLQGAFTCEGVQVLLNELTVAEPKEYCRYAFRERKMLKDSRIPHATTPFRLTQKEKQL
jgi:hypothetical protein